MKTINNFANLFNSVWFFEHTRGNNFCVNVYDVKPLIDELSKNSSFDQKELHEQISNKLDTLTVEKRFESASLEEVTHNSRKKFQLKPNTISFDCFWSSIDMDYNNSSEDVFIACSMEVATSLEIDVEDEDFDIEPYYFANCFSNGTTAKMAVLDLVDKQFNK